MVILGDHGMTEAGGHGGSSMRETSVPLVFIDGAQERANWSTDGVSDPSKPSNSIILFAYWFQGKSRSEFVDFIRF